MDKLAKVRAEVERIQLYTQSEVLKQVLEYIDKVQEEPVSNPTPNERMNKERFAEACRAACCDRNYRSHYGHTETRDDYFVDGVQWADEHPKEEPVSKIDFEQELYKHFGHVKDFTLGVSIAKRFYEMGRNHQEPVSEKKCMFTKDSYTDDDRKVLCEDCKEKCEYNKKEEPVSEELEEAANNALNNVLNAHEIVNVRSCLEMFKFGAEWKGKQDKETIELAKESVSGDLEDAATKYGTDEFPSLCGGCKHVPVDAFKAGANWQKEKEYTCYEEAFEDGAKWKVENLWKPAEGDDLPETDREVIALVQDYPDDKDHLRVVFAHRPNKYAKIWNYDLGEEQIVEVERYGKGEWNIPNIIYWLDVELPKEIEL